MFMFLFNKLRKLNKEKEEKRRFEEEKEKKWRDEWNEFYNIGDMILKAINLGDAAIGSDALGVEIKGDKNHSNCSAGKDS